MRILFFTYLFPFGLFAAVLNAFAPSYPPDPGVTILHIIENLNPGCGGGAHAAAFIALPGTSPFGVCTTQDGRKAYVSDLSPSSGGVYRIDALTYETILVADPLRTFYGPTYLATAPDGKSVYVSNFGNGGDGHTVSIISTERDSVFLELEVALGPTGICFDETNCYIACQNNGRPVIYEINLKNPTTNYNYFHLSRGTNPLGIGVAPGTHFLYVVCFGSSVIEVYDLMNTSHWKHPPPLKVINLTSSLPSPTDIAFTRSHAYITSTQPPYLLAIKTDPLPWVDKSIHFSYCPALRGIAVTPEKELIYTTSLNGSGISIIHGNENTNRTESNIKKVHLQIAISPKETPPVQGILGFITSSHLNSLRPSFTVHNTTPATIFITLALYAVKKPQGYFDTKQNNWLNTQTLITFQTFSIPPGEFILEYSADFFYPDGSFQLELFQGSDPINWKGSGPLKSLNSHLLDSKFYYH